MIRRYLLLIAGLTVMAFGAVGVREGTVAAALCVDLVAKLFATPMHNISGVLLKET